MPGTCGRTTCLFFFKGDVPLPSRTVLASSARQHAGPSPCRKLPLLALRASSSDRPLQHHRFPPGDDPLLNHQIDQSAGQFPVPGRPLQLFNLIRRKQTVNQLRRIMKRAKPAGANLLACSSRDGCGGRLPLCGPTPVIYCAASSYKAFASGFLPSPQLVLSPAQYAGGKRVWISAKKRL